MDLAYVDKLAKNNNGVQYLLVRQDLFDRTVEAMGMKTKDSKETVEKFSEMITKKNRPKKIWVDQGTEFAGEFKKVCRAEGIEICSTISETKAAFAERTKRSLKNTLYRYMEDYGYKYIHELPQFIATMISRNNRSIDKKPNHVKNSDFMSILYSKPLREYKKPKFGIGGRARISKYDSPFKNGYKPQLVQEIFEIVAIATKKPPTYTIEDKQEEVIREKFYEKVLISHLSMDSFTIELVSNASSQLFPNNTLSSFTNFLPEQANLDGQWEVAISEISYPSMYQNVTEGKFMFNDEKLSKQQRLTILNPDCIPPQLTLWKLCILSYKKETTTETLASQSKLAG